MDPDLIHMTIHNYQLTNAFGDNPNLIEIIILLGPAVVT